MQSDILIGDFMKKILTCILTVVMLLTIGVENPNTIVALEDDIYRNGTTYYDSLSLAVDTATAGDTIVFLHDATESSAVTITKNLVFDMNGATGNVVLVVNAGVTLTIKDTSTGGGGKITSSTSTVSLKTGATLVVDNSASVSTTGSGNSIVADDSGYTAVSKTLTGSVTYTPYENSKSVTPPVGKTFQYDTYEHIGVETNDSKYTLLASGDQCYEASEVGEYNFDVEPKNGYFWSDGTLDKKNITWSITKATTILTAVAGNPSSVTIANGETKTFKFMLTNNDADPLPLGAKKIIIKCGSDVIYDNNLTLTNGDGITSIVLPLDESEALAGLGSGTHTLKALFVGDGNFAESYCDFSLTVSMSSVAKIVDTEAECSSLSAAISAASAGYTIKLLCNVSETALFDKKNNT